MPQFTMRFRRTATELTGCTILARDLKVARQRAQELMEQSDYDPPSLAINLQAPWHGETDRLAIATIWEQ